MTGTGVMALAYAGSVAAALVTVVFSVLNRGRTPAALYLAVAMTAFAGWALADLVFMVAPQPRVQAAAVLAISPCAAVAVAAFFLLARTMTRYSRPPGRRVTALVSIEPVVMVLASVTDHGFGPPAHRGDWPFVLPWHPGPLFWLHAAYSYVVMGCGLLLLMRARRTAAPPYRGQQTVLVISTLLPAITNSASLACFALGIGLTDLSSVPFVVSGAISTWAILRQSMFRLAPIARDAVLEIIGDAIVVIDADDRVVDANATARRLFPGTLVGRAVHEVLPGPGEQTVGDVVLDVHVTDITDPRGRPAGRVLVARDVTQLHALRAELAEQATRDPLTGLHNRRRLTEALSAAARGPVAVLIVDIDHFKRINDTYGHAAGDDFLVAASRVLTPAPGETVARYGGEEFVVVLPGASPETARERAEHWRARFEALTVGPVRATISVGLAVGSGGQTPDELLQSADQALYEAKAGGRNQVRSAVPELAPRP